MTTQTPSPAATSGQGPNPLDRLEAAVDDLLIAIADPGAGWAVWAASCSSAAYDILSVVENLRAIILDVADAAQDPAQLAIAAEPATSPQPSSLPAQAPAA